jgi:hypothetical protein
LQTKLYLTQESFWLSSTIPAYIQESAEPSSLDVVLAEADVVVVTDVNEVVMALSSAELVVVAAG